jgi:DNA topoisomerase-3
VTLNDDHFEKDGETINFQRVAPTPAARGADEATLARVRLASTVTTAEPLSLPGKRRGQRRGADGRAARGRTSPRTREATPRAAKTARTPRPRAATAERATARSTERSSTRARARSAEPAPLDPRTAALADALRAWRLAEAKKRRAPAFRVLTDKTLLGIAAERPRSADALRAIPGFGPKLAATYTTAILSLVERATER